MTKCGKPARRGTAFGAGLLVLCLCMALTVPARAQGDQGTAVTVTYEMLEELLLAGNAELRQDATGRETMRLQLEETKKEHKKLMDRDLPMSVMGEPARLLQQEMKRLQLLLDLGDKERQRLINTRLYSVQMRYLEQCRLETVGELAALDAEQAGRALRDVWNLHQVGMAAQADLDNAERGLEDARQALQIAEGACRDNLAMLAHELGIGAQVRLGGPPDLELDAIPDRDLEADRAAYRLNAPGVRQSEAAAEAAEIAWELSKSDADNYARKAAREECAQTQELAEQEFDKVYQPLLEAYERYIGSGAVADAQRRYDTLSRQYEEGLVSRRQMEAGQYQLQWAQLRQQEAGLALCQSLLTYEFSLIDWNAPQPPPQEEPAA